MIPTTRKAIWIRLNPRLEAELKHLQEQQGRPSRSNMIEFACKSYVDFVLRGKKIEVAQK